MKQLNWTPSRLLAGWEGGVGFEVFDAFIFIPKGIKKKDGK